MIRKIIGMVMFVFCHCAASMDISVSGATVYMSGPAVGGECDKLKQIISAGQVSLVVLIDSNGRNDCSSIRGKNVFNAGLATQ
jgi:hypothetical protein